MPFKLFLDVCLQAPPEFQLRIIGKEQEQIAEVKIRPALEGEPIIITCKSASPSQIKSICIALRKVKRVKLFLPDMLQDSPCG